MTEVDDNPFEAPVQPDTNDKIFGSHQYGYVIVAALIGPSVLFPVFMLYGAIHGLSGLFGGERHFGMEGLRRGLFFAGFMTMYVVPPIMLAFVSAIIGFLFALLFEQKGKLYWSILIVTLSLLEYSTLLFWIKN